MKENTSKFVEQSISRLKVGTLISEMTPTTITGRTFQNECVRTLSSQPITLSLISEFYNASQSVNDVTAKEFGVKLGKGIAEESLAFSLALLSETLVTEDQYSAMNGLLESKIEEVICEGESHIKAELINGGFNAFRIGFPTINALVAQSLPISEDKVDNKYKISTPVSFIEEHDGCVYARVDDLVLKVDKAGISECSAPSDVFLKSSAVVNKVTVLENGEAYELNTPFGVIRMSDKGYELVGEERNTIMGEAMFSEFVGKCISANGNVKERRDLASTADYMSTFTNNIDKVSELDIFKVLENTDKGDKYLVSAHNGSLYIGVLEGRFRKSFTRYSTISEGLAKLKEMSGYEMKGYFENELKSEDALVAEHVEMVRNIDAEIVESEKVIAGISAELAVCDEGSSAYVAYMNLNDLTKNKIADLNKEKNDILSL